MQKIIVTSLFFISLAALSTPTLAATFADLLSQRLDICAQICNVPHATDTRYGVKFAELKNEITDSDRKGFSLYNPTAKQAHVFRQWYHDPKNPKNNCHMDVVADEVIPQPLKTPLNDTLTFREGAIWTLKKIDPFKLGDKTMALLDFEIKREGNVIARAQLNCDAAVDLKVFTDKFGKIFSNGKQNSTQWAFDSINSSVHQAGDATQKPDNQRTE